MARKSIQHDVMVTVGNVQLSGTLGVPPGARGVILFAHGSGSSRHSPRNRFVAGVLQEAGFATLLLDLMTPEEERVDASTGLLRFDIDFLADRLAAATKWAGRQSQLHDLPIGYFGASTGAAAALVAASRLPKLIQAVVSRGGRPDLAGNALTTVRAATLLIVGGADAPVIPLNRHALKLLAAPTKHMEIVPEATHLFEEPGALEQVATLARDWFAGYLTEKTTHVSRSTGMVTQTEQGRLS